jgi:hypothetical protein
LQLAHGRTDLALEVVLASDGHVADGICFQMLPRQLVWIAIRRIARQEKQPQFSAQGFNESRGLLGGMCGAAIDNENDRALQPATRRCKNSMKTAALTQPLPMIMNRM